MSIKLRFLALVVICSSFAGAQRAGTITVGPNVQVSKLRSDWEHNEVVLAVDPTDPKRMLAGSMFLDPERSNYSNVVYLTTDGGRIWNPTLDDRKGPGWMGDPAAAFGCDGKTVYYVSLRYPPSLGTYEALFYRSDNGGQTWSEPKVLPGMDREYITVDCTGSKHNGNIYIHGSRKGVTVFTSRDCGRNFSETPNTPEKGKWFHKNANGVVLSDGTYIAPFTVSSTEIAVIRSEDGGVTYSEPITVGPRQNQGSLSFFAADRSRSPFRDRVYAVWDDGLSKESNENQIWLRFSDDKGKTWTHGTIVNDRHKKDDGKNDMPHFMPSVAVNQHGVVGVSWYEGKENEDWTVRFAASCDGGRSFLPSVKVSEVGFAHSRMTNNLVEASVSGGASPMQVTNSPILFRTRGSIRTSGDTAGLEAGRDGVFHTVWIDNRTNVQQVWTAAISVDTKTACGGLEKFKGLNMITNQLAIEVEKAKYDPGTRSMSADLYFINRSDKTLEDSLIFQILDARGIEFLNSDNRMPGKGATFEFKAPGKLGPNQRTQSRSIKYRWSSPPEGISAGTPPNLFSQLVGDVFGKWSQ